MKRIRIRPKIRFRCKRYRYSETLDEFIETILHLFGTMLLGAILTLFGVVFSTPVSNSPIIVIGSFCSDLLIMSGCVILTLSTALMLGYMFVMVFAKRKE